MIKINSKDIEFLISNLRLPKEVVNELRELETENEKLISEETADKLRDLCTDKLDTHGFDLDYEPNELGKKLEELIDKLFIG